MTDRLAPLTYLSSIISSPKIVERIFELSYQSRLDGASDNMIQLVSSKLNINEMQTHDLINSILYVISESVYHKYNTPQEVFTIFKSYK